MKKTILKIPHLIALTIILNSCNGQIANNPQVGTNTSNKTTLVGGGCDGCELMYIGMPTVISSVDTSAAWTESGTKLLITGKVLQRDGRTPAADVIIYYWQTNDSGHYPSKSDLDRRVRRHGYVRGWIKTDEEGKYALYTIRPRAYADGSEPAHIHISIKEPDIENEYYIDDLVFDDDPLLIPAKKKRPFENRGGSGVLRVVLAEQMQIAEHNIILGLNIPNYPKSVISAKQSGLEIGEENPSFIPYHAYGPDKGSRACPVCKYGRYHGIIYFVGNKPNWEEIKNWLSFLEQESIARSKYLKAYFVYGNEKNYSREKRQKELEEIGKELKLTHLALTYVPSLVDKESEVNLNKINPEVENTFVIYRHRRIIDKYIDLKPTQENFKMISATLDKTQSKYVDLPEPHHQ